MRGVSFVFIHDYYIYMKRNSGYPFNGALDHDMCDSVSVHAFTFSASQIAPSLS